VSLPFFCIPHWHEFQAVKPEDSPPGVEVLLYDRARSPWFEVRLLGLDRLARLAGDLHREVRPAERGEARLAAVQQGWHVMAEISEGKRSYKGLSGAVGGS
jgi:hypothetical protein